jgi:antitoxin component of MazEF toxin-antitoxin module
LTIPPEIAEILGVENGEEIEFATTDHRVIIRKARER